MSLTPQITDISHNTIGNRFSNHYQQYFVSLDAASCIENQIGLNNNFIYVSNQNSLFQFANYPLKKMALEVVNDTIKEVSFQIEVNDIDSFYINLEKKLGKPDGAQLSVGYMKKYGYPSPSEEDSSSRDSFENLPNPKASDYKDLSGLAWDNLKSNYDPTDRNIRLSVRHTLRYTGPNHLVYTIRGYYRFSKY